MTNYTPSDFTDIRGPEEKPTVPGWYVYGHKWMLEHWIRIPNGTIAECMFDEFRSDGKWYSQSGGAYEDYDFKYWFGLKERT